jgi:hypothetical protein
MTVAELALQNLLCSGLDLTKNSREAVLACEAECRAEILDLEEERLYLEVPSKPGSVEESVSGAATVFKKSESWPCVILEREATDPSLISSTRCVSHHTSGTEKSKLSRDQFGWREYTSKCHICSLPHLLSVPLGDYL